MIHYIAVIETEKQKKLILWFHGCKSEGRPWNQSGFMKECNWFRWELALVFLLSILSGAPVLWDNRKD